MYLVVKKNNTEQKQKCSILINRVVPFQVSFILISSFSLQDFYSQTTWIELGNTGVLEGLGLPGADIGDIAGPGDATCTNCADAEVITRQTLAI